MALETTLHWRLGIGDNSHFIDEDVLDFLSIDKQENETSSDFFVPQLLQEVYFVNQLYSGNNEPIANLRIRDELYDYIRIFHGRIVDIFESHRDDLFQEVDSVEIKKELMGLSGANLGIYVQEHLPEPFLSRDVAYMIFNLLPSSYKYRLPHYARRDIVSSYKCFERYWNKGIALLCEMQNDVHTKDIEELLKLLEDLSEKNGKFRNNYLKEKGGCFSLTKVSKNESQQDVLCFSGQYFKKAINDTIDSIVNSGHFKNPFVIKESANVRYYLCPGRYVTFADARRTKKAQQPRMFSCCERKTFAEYDWHDVESYIMIVKYQPCELCQLSVYEHTNQSRGKVKAGVKLDPIKNIDLLNSIAEEIYNEIH